MSSGLGKCSKIRHIVRLRQMLRRWRNKARMSANRIPSDVPAGYVAICVGSNRRRFVLRATYLNHPVFKKLLIEAEEEYGFSNHGPLAIPCDEALFEEVLRFISRSESGNSSRFVNLEDFQRNCHVGIRSNLDFWPESRPLLHGFTEKTICGKTVGVAFGCEVPRKRVTELSVFAKVDKQVVTRVIMMLRRMLKRWPRVEMKWSSTESSRV